jgi:hypothetical protein
MELEVQQLKMKHSQMLRYFIIITVFTIIWWISSYK